MAATSTLRRTNGTPPITALTTNGIGLDRRVDGLVEAGLDRVNISLTPWTANGLPPSPDETGSQTS